MKTVEQVERRIAELEEMLRQFSADRDASLLKTAIRDKISTLRWVLTPQPVDIAPK